MLKKTLAELHLLLTPDLAHKAVFTNVPIIGFKNDRSLKDHLFRAALPKVDAEDRSKPCGRENRSCEVCESVNDTSHFKILIISIFIFGQYFSKLVFIVC